MDKEQFNRLYRMFDSLRGKWPAIYGRITNYSIMRDKEQKKISKGVLMEQKNEFEELLDEAYAFLLECKNLVVKELAAFKGVNEKEMNTESKMELRTAKAQMAMIGVMEKDRKTFVKVLDTVPA